VSVPVVAAGGIADGRGVAAALTLGAAGVQIGTAFLACDESNASAEHKQALRSAAPTSTFLTRAYTGRLARGLTNRLGETLQATGGPFLPYPMQRELLRVLQTEASKQGRTDLLTMWSGQAAPLIKHHRAADLFASLVKDTEAALLAAMKRDDGVDARRAAGGEGRS
jgi:nitronate monooxygenase